LFIRDEIAIPNLHRRKAQNYMRVVVILLILKIFLVDAFGINVTGNLTLRLR
jgi:hypothetical protein